MSNLRTLPRSEWSSFFNRISKSLLGKKAEIEVASPELGDQILVEWVPLIGVTYDSKDDLLDVALDRVDHLVYHPTEIAVDEGSDGVRSIAVLTADGTKQVIRLKEVLPLPA